MKKLMITAAALCATVGVYAEVQSANIVGYKTYTLSSTYSLLGLCFQDTNGADMTLDKAIPYTAGMTKGTVSNSDTVQVMGLDGNYKVYFLSDGTYGKNNASYSEAYDGKWLKSAGQANTDTVTSGQALWYVSRTANTTPHAITIAGSVLMTTAVDPKECTSTYTLIGNPYAVEVPLNGGLVTTGATKGTTSTADTVQVMGEDGNYKVYFLSDGTYGKNNASYSEAYDGKWLRSAGTACTDTVPAGGALWYVSHGAGTTVQLRNPIAE